MENIIDPYKWFKVERLEFLADGLFAIVITLLVLEIKVPVGEHVNSSNELLTLLKVQFPKFLSYIMSFVVLMLFWSNYITQFKFIEKCDRGLLLINIYLLLGVSLVPFSTAFLSENIHFKLAIIIYWANLIVMGTALGIQWNYVYKNGLTERPAAELAEVNRIFILRGKTAMPLYTLCAALCFISNYLSIGLILFVQLCFALGIDQKVRIAMERNRD